LRLDQWGKSTSGDSLYHFALSGLRQKVEGNAHAKQENIVGNLVWGSAKRGVFVGSFRRESGGRPGTPSLSLDYGYGLQRASFAAQKNNIAVLGGKMTVQVAYRNNSVTLQPRPLASVTPIRDKQLGAEIQLTRKNWLAGAAWSRVERVTDFALPHYLLATPLEPLEQVTPDGTTEQGLLYALQKRSLSPFVTLTAGPVYASYRTASSVQTGSTHDSTHQLQLMGDLALRLTDKKTLHLRTTPHLVTGASDLFPAAIATPLQENPATAGRQTVNGFNHDPYLPSAKGRSLLHEVVLGETKKALHLNTRLFQNQIFQYFAQSADPRLSPLFAVTRQTSTNNAPQKTFVATPIASGKITGMEQQVRWEVSPRSTLNFSATYQQTKTNLLAQNTNGELTRVVSHLPYIPQWQGTFGADWRHANVTLSLEGFYLGERSTITTTQSELPARVGTFTVREIKAGKLKSATGANIHVRYAMGRQTLQFSTYNLGGVQFYPGNPTKTAYSIGFNMPF
jgi:hypothetical protein